MGPNVVSDLILAADAGLFAWAVTGLFTLAMVRRQRLGDPAALSLAAASGARGEMPVPRGGGIGVVLAVIILWPLWFWPVPLTSALILAGFATLALTSWLEDRGAVPPLVRLAVQGLTIGLCVSALPADQRLLPDLPLDLERGLLALAWLGFTNLFHSMDRVDGLAGSACPMLALGYIAVLSVAGQQSSLLPLALIIASASLGYLLWNWQPARVVMGKVGTLALGFLLGWLMVDLGMRGQSAAALILPLYFCADAALVWLGRLVRGPGTPITPFYQRALDAGLSHADVATRIIALNCLLLMLALISVRRPAFALVMAAIAVGAVLVHFANLQTQDRPRSLVS
jgi:UDP-N-acetylmuramyl pentapeptide phosphotransferase/UDP-N-acetylglucosamine-1-phosphate transferase